MHYILLQKPTALFVFKQLREKNQPILIIFVTPHPEEIEHQ